MEAGERVEADQVAEDAQDSQLPPLPSLDDLPTMEEVFPTHIPTHKWLPKATQGELAREAAVLWDRMASNPEEE